MTRLEVLVILLGLAVVALLMLTYLVSQAEDNPNDRE